VSAVSLPRAVAEARVTCHAVPWQAEGRLWDGPWFYFRIRSGRASLGFGATVQDAVADSFHRRLLIDAGEGGNDEVPFSPTDAEAWALFDKLFGNSQ